MEDEEYPYTVNMDDNKKLNDLKKKLLNLSVGMHESSKKINEMTGSIEKLNESVKAVTEKWDVPTTKFDWPKAADTYQQKFGDPHTYTSNKKPASYYKDIINDAYPTSNDANLAETPEVNPWSDNVGTAQSITFKGKIPEGMVIPNNVTITGSNGTVYSTKGISSTGFSINESPKYYVNDNYYNNGYEEDYWHASNQSLKNVSIDFNAKDTEMMQTVWSDYKPAVADKINKKKPVVKTKEEKVEPKATGYFFKGNCAKWHEVTNEKHLLDTEHEFIKWFYSDENSESEFGCQCQHDRVYPCFSAGEMAIVKETIAKHKNGYNGGHFYSFDAIGNMVQIPEAHTINLGGVPFHYNSSQKIWYIAMPTDIHEASFQFGELAKKALKLVPKSYTKISTLAFTMPSHAKEIADQTKHILKMQAQQKKQEEQEAKDQENNYQFTGYSQTAYTNIITNAHEYGWEHFKGKAKQAQKIVLSDLKLAKKNKDKKHYEKCVKFLELAEQMCEELEDNYISTIGTAKFKNEYKAEDLFRYTKTTY